VVTEPAVEEQLAPKVEEPFHDSVSAETEMKELVNTIVSNDSDVTVGIDPLVTETPTIEETSTSEELPIIKKALKAAHHHDSKPIISGSDEAKASKPLEDDTDKELCAEANRAWDTIHNTCLHVCRVPMNKYTFDVTKHRCFLKSASERAAVKQTSKPKELRCK